MSTSQFANRFEVFCNDAVLRIKFQENIGTETNTAAEVTLSRADGNALVELITQVQEQHQKKKDESIGGYHGTVQ